MVRIFSKKSRGIKLVVLGDYRTDNKFHNDVLNAASSEVIFPGAIYETSVLNPLRFFSKLYLHGHTVGGTNPSLVEALGAGNAVIAQDNKFNRWVAGDAAVYFTDENSFETELESLLVNPEKIVSLRKNSYRRHTEAFSWNFILSEYEKLIKLYSAN
jgi:glycosyltransferase involved in cell wall biosynthesis